MGFFHTFRGIEGDFMVILLISLAFEIHFSKSDTNTNALNLITLKGITPHPIPLPSGERGG